MCESDYSTVFLEHAHTSKGNATERTCQVCFEVFVESINHFLLITHSAFQIIYIFIYAQLNNSHGWIPPQSVSLSPLHPLVRANNANLAHLVELRLVSLDHIRY